MAKMAKRKCTTFCALRKMVVNAFSWHINSTIYIEHKFTHCSTIKATNAIPLSSLRPFLFALYFCVCVFFCFCLGFFFVSFFFVVVTLITYYIPSPAHSLHISQPYFHVSSPIRSPTYCYRTYSDFDPFYSGFLLFLLLLLALFVAQYVRVYECVCLFHRLHTPFDCKAQQKNYSKIRRTKLYTNAFIQRSLFCFSILRFGKYFEQWFCFPNFCAFFGRLSFFCDCVFFCWFFVVFIGSPFFSSVLLIFICFAFWILLLLLVGVIAIIVVAWFSSGFRSICCHC